MQTDNSGGLNLRQNTLFCLLYSSPTEWFKSKEIYERMQSSLAPYDQPSEESKFWSEVGEEINADIAAINAEIGKRGQAIISNRAKGYKFANREEYEEYSDRRFDSLMRSIADLSRMDKARGYNRSVKRKYREQPTFTGENPGSARIPESANS